MAKGHTWGLLHLKNVRQQGNEGQAEIARLESRMALTLFGNLSLSIANVKLSESFPAIDPGWADRIV